MTIGTRRLSMVTLWLAVGNPSPFTFRPPVVKRTRETCAHLRNFGPLYVCNSVDRSAEWFVFQVETNVKDVRCLLPTTQ